MISTYFDLVNQLIKQYSLQSIATYDTFTQLQHASLVINIIQLPNKSVLLTIVNDKQISNVVIDDNTFNVNLPIESVNDELSLQFHQLLAAKLDNVPQRLLKLADNNPVSRSTQPSSLLKNPTPQSTFTRPNDMPDFDDEYELKSAPKSASSSAYPSIGGDDLDPPGIPKHPRLQPFLDPLAESNPDGGMYPTANNPIFGSRPSGNTGRLGVPPGARFDDPLGEDNLDDLGMGLPGNLRRPGPGGPGGNRGFPGFGPGGSNEFPGGSGFGSGSGGFGF